MANVTIENLLNKIADALITNINVYSDNPNQTLKESQKVVKDGVIKSLRETNEKMVLFQSSKRANREDLGTSFDDASTPVTLESLVNTTLGSADINNITIHVNNSGVVKLTDSGGSTTDFVITDLLVDPSAPQDNPLNLSQFVGLSNTQKNIKIDAAKEFLDTNIHELLPSKRSRQQRIDDLFNEFKILTGQKPTFTPDDLGDIYVPPGYNQQHDISSAQDDPENYTGQGGEESSFITRLNIDANEENTDKTIQSLRDDLNEYLKDIDQEIVTEVQDEREEYENKSEGYLKIRSLNQGIVIRKQEGDGIGLEKDVSIQNVYDISGQEHPHCYDIGGACEGSGPSYLMDGFTISMWVRFLDKTSKGTLFNFGNPTRPLDPKGFKLETYVLNKNDEASSGLTWGHIAEDSGNTDLFKNTEEERFIRLVLYDHLPHSSGDPEFRLYDSHIGMGGFDKDHNLVPEFNIDSNSTADYNVGWDKYLLTNTRVPVDFNEWFFIVANYNPILIDVPPTEGGFSPTVMDDDSDYWRGNRNPDGSYTHYSGYGSKCKVEIISKTDLLRARGYKT